MCRHSNQLQAQCSEVDTAEGCSATLLRGFEAGQKEITNEMLFWMCTQQPTGNVVLDAVIHGLVVVIRAGFGVYLEGMVSQYVQPKFQRSVSDKK